MPRENPKAAVEREIAIVSEEIDRLEQYEKEPETLKKRLQELTAKRSELLARFREVNNVPPQPKDARPKKKEG
jgi:cell shape-determining protein MreC